MQIKKACLCLCVYKEEMLVMCMAVPIFNGYRLHLCKASSSSFGSNEPSLSFPLRVQEIQKWTPSLLQHVVTLCSHMQPGQIMLHTAQAKILCVLYLSVCTDRINENVFIPWFSQNFQPIACFYRLPAAGQQVVRNLLVLVVGTKLQISKNM